MPKRILKIASITVAGLAALLIAALLFFSSSPGEKIIKNQLEKMINEKSGLTATIGKFETNLFSRIQIEETTVISPTFSGNDSLLYIGKMKITYSIFGLLSGDTNIKSAIIDNVNINISVDSLGNYGVPMLDTEKEAVSKNEKTSVSVFVGSVALTAVNVTYTDKRMLIDINLYNLWSHISGRGANNYDGRLSADSILTRYEGQPFLTRNISCDFSWDGQSLAVKSIADLEELDLAVDASLRLPELGELSLNASLEGDPSELVKIIKTKYELPQIEIDNIGVKIDAAGSVESPEIAFMVSSSRSRFENIDLDLLRLYGRYSSDGIFIDTAIVETLGGNILARGLLSLEDTSSINIDLRIDGIELSELWPPIYGHESPFTGILKGSVQAKGKADSFAGWDIKGGLDISRLLYQGRPAEEMGIDFSVDNDVAHLTLVHAEDTVKTSAILKNGNIQGEFYANIPKISSVSRFVDIPDLKGTITAEGVFGGSTNNPMLKARLRGNNISYQNFPIDSMAADIQYRDSRIVISSLKLSGSRPESARYQSILGVDSLYGRFEYDCDIRGSSDSLEGEIIAKIASLEYSGYAVDTVFASAAISGSSIKLNNLIIHCEDLIVETSGSFDTVSNFGALRTNIFSRPPDDDEFERGNTVGDGEKIDRGTVTTEFSLTRDNKMRINVDCDTIWIGLLKYFTESDAPESGFVNFNLAFEGNTTDPTGSLSAAAYSIKHPSYEIDSVLVAADLDGEHFYLSKFQMFAYGNSVSANSGIYFDRNAYNKLILGEESAIYGELTVDGFDLSVLEPYTIPLGELTGISSAEIAWDGTIKNPGLTGWLEVSNGHLRFAEQSTPLDKIHLGLSLSDSILSIDSASFYSAGTPLSAKGTVKYDLEGNYEISANLSAHDIGLVSAEGKIKKDSLDLRIFSDDFHLYVIEPFVAMADSLGGKLESEILIKGKAAMPEITGFVKISDFSLFSSELSAVIKSGLIDIKFDRSRVDIDSLFAEFNGGSLNAKGYLIHDAGTLTDINLSLKASNIFYEKTGIFKSKLQFADLTYNQKEDQYFLDGDISLGESRLTAKFPLKSILPWARSVETVEYELPEIIARTRLNVRFRENDDLWIDNNLAHIRMKAELGVIGTPVRPNLSGPINVEEGYLIYLDNNFKVEEGKLYFSDPSKLNPEIKLLARTQVTEYKRTVAEKYTIYIKVEGNLEDPRPDIYSEPPLDKSDIVALLTLKTTRSRLAGDENQGGIRNVLVERASRLTSDRVSGYISDKVGSMFGFDEFTVEGNLFRFDKSWGPRLVASRRISKRVELTYSTTVGHLNDQGVRLGYKLTPRISIQGETDQAGRSGIDLRYGLKFK